MLRVQTLPLALLTVSLLLSSCQELEYSQEPEHQIGLGTESSRAVAALTEDERAAKQAIAAIEAADYDTALSALEHLIFSEQFALAEVALAEGEPEDTLGAIDRALGVRPYNEAAIRIKAEGSMMLARRMIANGVGALYVEGALVDSLESYLALPTSAVTMLGASEAAAQIGRLQPALDYARAARDIMTAGGVEESDTELQANITRAWAEASYRAFTAQYSFQQSTGANGESMVDGTDALFREAKDSLARYVGHRPDDVWSWRTLGDLHTWIGNDTEAAAIFGRAIDRMPENQELLERLLSSSKNLGPGAAIAAFEALNARHPQNAAALFMLGRLRIREALPGVADTPAETRHAFVDAEAELVRARNFDLEDTAMTSACLGWEVIARDGQGWCDYNNGNLDSAMETFLSMEELFEGGMAWQLGADLRSGVDGLWYVGDQFRQAGKWESAASAFAALHAYQPTDPNWANNTGFFYRDAGVEAETMARELCAAAHGLVTDEVRLGELRLAAAIAPELFGTPGEVALFQHAANEHASSAIAMLEKSYEAYIDASDLVPEDVRIVNDTALVLVYYLHKDLELAEKYLLRSIAMGEEQLALDAAKPADEALDGVARGMLTEAYGDAYQNLGVLHLLHKQDPAGAIPFFEKSVEIGPSPRPFLTEALIPFAKGDLDAPIEQVMPEIQWGASCPAPE
jgi:tetratricopeptide (TPR) repeat protein